MKDSTMKILATILFVSMFVVLFVTAFSGLEEYYLFIFETPILLGLLVLVYLKFRKGKKK